MATHPFINFSDFRCGTGSRFTFWVSVLHGKFQPPPVGVSCLRGEGTLHPLVYQFIIHPPRCLFRKGERRMATATPLLQRGKRTQFFSKIRLEGCKNGAEDSVKRIACDFPPGKVEFFGSYERHECGLRVHYLNTRDRGYWHCEMEKYYLGFSRRY